MRIKILVRLKGQILEPQGKVIEQSLNRLGLDLPDNMSKEEKVQKIDSACKKLLVNDIIEEYEVLG